MKIQSTNNSHNTAFSSLMNGGNLQKILDSNPAKSFLRKVDKSRNVIVNNSLDKKSNIDIILDTFFYDNSMFTATISSKKQGVPYYPGVSKLIPVKGGKKILNEFIEWVNGWDYAYSKKGLKEFKKLEEKAFEILSQR